MKKIDFFVSALDDVRNRVLASYQEPNNFRPTHMECIDLFKQIHSVNNFSLTKSCTQSLEIAIGILDLPLGSEIILPSFAFVSCANAINNYGYKCVFVDCELDTMNINPVAVKAAITPLTKAVLTINYAGISCDYDQIVPICKENDLYLIEDNAHGFLSTYNTIPLGNFGDISVISFDHMKNISCEEGGGITINNPQFQNSCWEFTEFGTNRKDFFDGKVDQYEWVNKGSNCFLAESLSKILYYQLQNSTAIIDKLRKNWNLYFQLLIPLVQQQKIKVANIGSETNPNGHIFWVLVKDLQERSDLVQYLRKRGVYTSFHYVPLHSSKYGKRVGRFAGKDINTTKGSESLIRLPQHHLLDDKDIMRTVESISQFYGV